MFPARSMLAVIGAGIVMMGGFMLGVAAISATVRNLTPTGPRRSGAGPADDLRGPGPDGRRPVHRRRGDRRAPTRRYVELGVVKQVPTPWIFVAAALVVLADRALRCPPAADRAVPPRRPWRPPRDHPLGRGARSRRRPARVPAPPARPRLVRSTSTDAGTTPSSAGHDDAAARALGRRDPRAVLARGTAVGCRPHAEPDEALWYRRTVHLPDGFVHGPGAAALRRRRPGLRGVGRRHPRRRPPRRLPARSRSTSPTRWSATRCTSSSCGSATSPTPRGTAAASRRSSAEASGTRRSPASGRPSGWSRSLRAGSTSSSSPLTSRAQR